VSDFVVYSHCNVLSVHPLALMLLSRFSFRNIKYHSALFFSSCNVSSLCMGNSACCLCNWFNSFNSDLFPFSPNSFKPSLTFIWVMITWAWGTGTFFIVDSWPFCYKVYLGFLLLGLGLRLYLLFLSIFSDSGKSSVTSFLISGSMLICSVLFMHLHKCSKF